MRLLAAATASLVAVLMLTASASAAGFKRDQTPLNLGSGGSGTVHSSSGGAFARLGLGLVLVVALIFGIYWFMKRSGRSRAGGGKLRGGIDVVATAPLGPNRAVHLLRVGDELVLVGAAEGGVRPIKVYSGSEADALAEALDPSGPLRPAQPSRNLIDELRRRTAR